MVVMIFMDVVAIGVMVVVVMDVVMIVVVNVVLVEVVMVVSVVLVVVVSVPFCIDHRHEHWKLRENHNLCFQYGF